MTLPLSLQIADNLVKLAGENVKKTRTLLRGHNNYLVYILRNCSTDVNNSKIHQNCFIMT